MIKTTKGSKDKKRASGEPELTMQERRAVNYAISNPGCTQVEAYKAAFPLSRSWKHGTVAARAGKFFQRSHIQLQMRRALSRREDDALRRRERILTEWEKIAYTNLPGIIDYKGGTVSIKEFKKLTPAQRACIQEFTVRTVREITASEPVPISEVRIKLHSKVAALEALSKHAGMFVQKMEHSGVVASMPPEQVLAALLDMATDEERAVIEGMAQRLTGRHLPEVGMPARIDVEAVPLEPET